MNASSRTTEAFTNCDVMVIYWSACLSFPCAACQIVRREEIIIPARLYPCQNGDV